MRPVQLAGNGPEPPEALVGYPASEQVRLDSGSATGFLTYCLKVKPAGDFAQRSDFSPELLRAWIGNIMILDYLPEQDDFRYRMYGTAIAEQSGFDMTRKLVSDFRSEIGAFFLSLYRESVAKHAIICSINSAVHATYTCDWHRVICPAKRGDTVQIVACNFPGPRKT